MKPYETQLNQIKTQTPEGWEFKEKEWSSGISSKTIPEVAKQYPDAEIRFETETSQTGSMRGKVTVAHAIIAKNGKTIAVFTNYVQRKV